MESETDETPSTGADVPVLLKGLITHAATTLARSLNDYWPADAYGRNDLPEANTSFHFAHALLSRGFAVFAEADHPRPGVQGVDLLAISSNRQRVFPFEFKRYTSGCMGASIDDLDRIASFRLNGGLRVERCGTEPVRAAGLCVEVVGVVAGLCWHNAGHEGALKGNGQARFESKLIHLGGELLDPVKVKTYEASKVSGSYYLNAAFLPSLQHRSLTSH